MGEFFYEEQLKRYALQFNAIFSGMVVQTGKTDKRDQAFLDVPIVYASMDRVAAAAATGHTQNKHIRLPMMSSNITGFDIATDRMKGTGSIDRQVFVPLGGVLPDDARVVRRRMAVPYDLTFDLHIYASNKDQQFQILEQIMPLFDPVLQIQTSESHLDTAKIVTVQLMSINNEENFPPGTESRQILTSIQFKVDAYITIPATVKNDVVRQVFARVSAISDGGIGTIVSSVNNPDIPTIYDDLGIEPILMSTAYIDDIENT